MNTPSKFQTDLDRLHLVPEFLERVGSRVRRVGKTLYACHCIAGQLEVLHNTTIIVVVDKLGRVPDFYQLLCKVLQEHGIEIYKCDRSSFRVFFKNNSNNVKFISYDNVRRTGLDQYGADLDQYPVYDLEGQSNKWWQEANNTPIRYSQKVIQKYIKPLN